MRFGTGVASARSMQDRHPLFTSPDSKVEARGRQSSLEHLYLWVSLLIPEQESHCGTHSVPASWALGQGRAAWLRGQDVPGLQVEFLFLEVWWPGDSHRKGCMLAFAHALSLSLWLFSHLVWQISNHFSNSVQEMTLQWRLLWLLNWADFFPPWIPTIYIMTPISK